MLTFVANHTLFFSIQVPVHLAISDEIISQNYEFNPILRSGGWVGGSIENNDNNSVLSLTLKLSRDRQSLAILAIFVP